MIEDAAVLISKLGHRAKRRFQVLLEPTGLRSNHAQVITYVYEHAGASQRDVVEALRVTPSMVVELVDYLEQSGYVVRERRPGDRRAWAMRLTPAGERVWEQVLEISAQVQDELLAPLAPRDRGRLVGYLRELDGNFAGR
ncbi:MAG TPA: MarR family transcriptional regulator [Solirubrobacteraceae bacterium]|nr:MarR family transcriptional regulator [Solirubrobacteraceae bacterium]